MHVARRTCYDERMKNLLVLAMAAAVWTGAALHATQTPASTWSGVYTEAQAKSGHEAYVKHCAECHGQDLGGDGFAPGLKGPEFMNNWNGLSVGELYDRIRVSMPPSNPNAVSAKEKVEIVAYILKEDGFPAGATELPATVDAMKAIKFEATKPGAR
jgi:S-disulfanyl-L-cysteine oxidoreductase SoxD